MKRCIVGGSPNADGRTAALADLLFQMCIEDCPDDEVSILSVASLEIDGCIGCEQCRKAVDDDDALPLPEEGDPLYPTEALLKSNARKHLCIFEDDMQIVRRHIDACDELIVVTPVYFASVPSQFKALLDRLQPYFWSNARKTSHRPVVVHVVGEGGDPFGFDPLLTTLASALRCAGFYIDQVLDWVGKIDQDGEITEDARIYPFSLGKSKEHSGAPRKLRFDR